MKLPHLSSILLGLFLSAPVVAAQSVDSVTVAGIVRNIPTDGQRTVIINECDKSDKSARIIAELSPDGSFRERMPISFGHTFTVNYNRSLFVNAYAEPGDSVFIDIDATNLRNGFSVSGSHAELNRQYSKAFEDLSEYRWNARLADDHAPLAEYLARFKEVLAQLQEKTDRYVAENGISPEVAAMLRADNLFCLSNMAIEYKGAAAGDAVAFLTDSVFDICNPANARVMMFPYHLSDLMLEDPRYWRKVPAGIVRDLMLVSVADDPDADFSRDDFSDKAYYDRVFENTLPDLDWTGIKEGELVVLAGDSVRNVGNADPLSWISRQFPGRYVYLDVSASWCAPCRAALAASESTREHFRHSDNVAFVVLWIWSQFDEWAALAPMFHNAVHIFVPDTDMSNRIAGKLGILGVPSYCLIKPDGRIVRDSVPRFNSPDLINYLSKLPH